MLTFSIYLVGALLVMVCLLIVLLVLMQRPKQEGLGAAFGAGVTDQIWGSQTTNVLQKGTVYLGVLFFVLSITLCMLEARKSRQYTGMKVPTAPVIVTPASPATPASTTSTPFEIPAPVPATPAPAEGTPAPATPAAAETPAPAETPATAPAETPAPATPPAAETPAPAAEAPAAEAPAADPAAPAAGTPAPVK